MVVTRASRLVSCSCLRAELLLFVSIIFILVFKLLFKYLLWDYIYKVSLHTFNISIDCILRKYCNYFSILVAGKDIRNSCTWDLLKYILVNALKFVGFRFHRILVKDNSVGIKAQIYLFKLSLCSTLSTRMVVWFLLLHHIIYK